MELRRYLTLRVHRPRTSTVKQQTTNIQGRFVGLTNDYTCRPICMETLAYNKLGLATEARCVHDDTIGLHRLLYSRLVLLLLSK